MRKTLYFAVGMVLATTMMAGMAMAQSLPPRPASHAVTNLSINVLTAGTVIGSQSNLIANAYPASNPSNFLTMAQVGISGATCTQIVNGLAYPLTGNPSGFVDQTVTNGLLGVAGNGSALTGITAAQVGAVSNNAAGIAAAGGLTNPAAFATAAQGAKADAAHTDSVTLANSAYAGATNNTFTAIGSYSNYAATAFDPSGIWQSWTNGGTMISNPGNALFTFPGGQYGHTWLLYNGNGNNFGFQDVTSGGVYIIPNDTDGHLFAFQDWVANNYDPLGSAALVASAATNYTDSATNKVYQQSANAFATAAQGAEADTAVQRTGDTNVITLTSAAEVSVPNPVNMMDAANYGTVLGLFSGGDFYYNSGYTSAVNTAYFAFQQSIPPPGSRVYSITGASVGTYVGQVMTTNKFLEVFGQVSVNCYMHCTSGNADIIAEIYYSYDGTNWVGDFASQSQNIASSTATNLYQWNLTFPTIVATNTTGFYVARKFKVAAQSGSPTLTIFFGTNSVNGTASHISFPVQPLSLGDRGATNVINASGLAGTYDAASRTAMIATDTIYATQSQATNISQGVVSAFATTGTVANAGNAATVTTLTGSQIAAAGGLTNPASFDISGTAVSVAAGYLPLAGGTMTNGIYFSPAPSTACILLPVDPAFLGPNRPSCSFASLEKDNNHIVTNIFLVTGLGLEWFSGLTLSWLDVLDSANYATYITQPSTNAANIAALSNTTMTINGTVMKIGTNNAITVIGGSGISGDTATNIADSRIAAWAPTGTVANAGNAATVTTITGAQIAVAGGLTNPAAFATAAQGALVADATLGNTGLYNQVQVALTNYIAADTISRTNYVAANTIAMTNLQAIITAGDNIANTNGMAYTIASTNGVITGYATWGIIGGVLITNNTVYLGTTTGVPSIAALGTTNFLFTAGGNSARFGF